MTTGASCCRPPSRGVGRERDPTERSRVSRVVLARELSLKDIRAIREQISSAINLIVQQARLSDGSRKITYITEVQGMEGDTILLELDKGFKLKVEKSAVSLEFTKKTTGTKP